jgi:hypothetical protein
LVDRGQNDTQAFWIEYPVVVPEYAAAQAYYLYLTEVLLQCD